MVGSVSMSWVFFFFFSSFFFLPLPANPPFLEQP
jgi:hypothetical protein